MRCVSKRARNAMYRDVKSDFRSVINDTHFEPGDREGDSGRGAYHRFTQALKSPRRVGFNQQLAPVRRSESCKQVRLPGNA